MAFYVEISIGHVSRHGPYRTRSIARREVEVFQAEVAKRPASFWWACEATDHQRPDARVVELNSEGTATTLRKHLRDWDLPT